MRAALRVTAQPPVPIHHSQSRLPRPAGGSPAYARGCPGDGRIASNMARKSRCLTAPRLNGSPGRPAVHHQRATAHLQPTFSRCLPKPGALPRSRTASSPPRSPSWGRGRQPREPTPAAPAARRAALASPSSRPLSQCLRTLFQEEQAAPLHLVAICQPARVSSCPGKGVSDVARLRLLGGRAAAGEGREAPAGPSRESRRVKTPRD